EFTDRFSADPAVDQARLNLARLYERNNQPQLALEMLSKMTASNPQQQSYSPSAAEAQERIKTLIAKFPSLMPSNPAPTMTPTPTPPAPTPQRTDRPLVLKPETPFP